MMVIDQVMVDVAAAPVQQVVLFLAWAVGVVP
jgi:hypothetical protein